MGGDVLPVFLAVALLLGFKHSYDADHLVAVSNFLVKSPSHRSTARLTTSWAAGHMITASIITITLYVSSRALLKQFLDNLQLSVVIMLVAIGLFGIISETRYYHEHIHRHIMGEHSHLHYHTSMLGRIRGAISRDKNPDVSGEPPHSPGDPHMTMFGIGIVHGLASNDELLILLTASIGLSSLRNLLVGVGVFSVGVVLGMIVYGIAITYPMVKFGQGRVRRLVNLSVAVLSIAYAVLLLAGIENLNPFSGLLTS